MIDWTLGTCEVIVAARVVRATTSAGEPVIGVILMVAITVILAAVTGTFDGSNRVVCRSGHVAGDGTVPRVPAGVRGRCDSTA